MPSSAGVGTLDRTLVLQNLPTLETAENIVGGRAIAQTHVDAGPINSHAAHPQVGPWRK